jgi:hypothetical protein
MFVELWAATDNLWFKIALNCSYGYLKHGCGGIVLKDFEGYKKKLAL